MRKKYYLLLVLVALVGLAIGVSCSPKQTGRWLGADYSKEVGAIPEDVCIVRGEPMILGASTESGGGFVLIYLRNNGDVVAHQWLTNPITDLGLQDSGEFYWAGGTCPSSE